MKIGIDATCWANRRGYGRFTRELVGAMVALAPRHEFVCFLDRQADSLFALDAPNVSRLIVEQRVAPATAASANGYRSPVDMLRLQRAVARAKPDVFFSPSVYSFFPLPLRLPAVVTIHDAIAERFPQLTLTSARARLFWTLKVRLALWQSRLVLTVSEFAAKEIASVHRVPPARIRIALEAPAADYRAASSPADVRDAAERVGLPPGSRWLTYVGGFNPHKNLDVLIRAHANAARKHPDLFLILAGTLTDDVFHTNVPSIQAAVRECGTEHLVRWPGFVADDALRHLHAGAVALVLPSQNEGFGLPAIEAAACGAAVIATTASPLPQLLEGAGIFVRPGDLRALATAIDLLATDAPMRQRLAAEGRKRSAALTWPRGARAALDAIEEAAA
jgi:glycosyltransferase involved in cell wall biosynthesis